MTDITFKAGNTILLKVTVTDLDTSQVLDLTGASIKFKFAKKATTALPEVEKTTAVGDGVEITDALGGKFEVTLDPADTVQLKGTRYYEADVVEAGGRVSTVISGTMTIEATLLRA